MESVNNTLQGYITGNDTLDELNFRCAQTLLPLAVLFGLFCFMGIVGNSVVIMVFLYSKEYKDKNFKIFVLCLAAVDLMSCVTLMPAEIVETRHVFLSKHNSCKVKCFFNLLSMITSALILLVICVYRYRKVCHPLRKQIWPGMAIKILTGALLLAFLLAIPAPILCSVTEHVISYPHGANITLYECSAGKRYTRSAIDIYRFGLSILLVIISVALIATYVMILKTLVQHLRNREFGETIRFDIGQSSQPSADKIEVNRINRIRENGDVCLNLKPVGGETHESDNLKKYPEAFPDKVEFSCIRENEDACVNLEAGGEMHESDHLRQYPEASVDKVEVNRTKENEDVRVNLKTAGGETHVTDHREQYTDGSQMNRKVNGDNKRSRSVNSFFKGQFSAKSTKGDELFSTRVIRHRSTSAAARRLPYKTLIWFILTVIFLVTFLTFAGLSFIRTSEYLLSPTKLFLVQLFSRMYFVNNIINPFIYAWVDKRFNKSLKKILSDIRGKFCSNL